MSKITIIIGLPGSGKTHLGQSLSEIREIPFFDDCATIEDSWNAAVKCIKENKDCILTDPKFCKLSTYTSLCIKLSKIITHTTQFEYHYFANEPEICIQNISDRDSRIISKGFITRLSKNYHPLGSNIYPCYRKHLTCPYLAPLPVQVPYHSK